MNQEGGDDSSFFKVLFPHLQNVIQKSCESKPCLQASISPRPHSVHRLKNYRDIDKGLFFEFPSLKLTYIIRCVHTPAKISSQLFVIWHLSWIISLRKMVIAIFAWIYICSVPTTTAQRLNSGAVTLPASADNTNTTTTAKPSYSPTSNRNKVYMKLISFYKPPPPSSSFS